MSDSEIIKAKLRRLLPQLDLETATQRTIQQHLEDELGIPLDSYKAIIKAEVDAFLLGYPDSGDQRPAGHAATPMSNDHDQPSGPSPKRPRTMPPSEAPGTVKRENNGAGPTGYSVSTSLSSKRYAGVRTFKNATFVDVREFYEKDGQLAPGQKGLSMTPSQWQTLTAGMQSVSEALDRGDERFLLDLGNSRRASVGSYGGKRMVQLREYYEKDGAMLPGKKGIALPPDQWNNLVRASGMLTKHLPTMDAKERPTPLPEGASEDLVVEEEKHHPEEIWAGSPEAALSVFLGNMRRAEAIRWREKIGLDLREFYKKADGQMAHGKKGLYLLQEEVASLRHGADDLTKALESLDTSFQCPLSAT